MNYSINSGWGRAQTSGFPFRATGRIFLVAKSAVANRSIISDLFRDDPEGKSRIYATLDAAVSACTADAGDIIYVAPGHTESIIAATTLALDVAGVKIIGLGEGNLRPTFTFTTATTANIAITRDDVTIENCIFDLQGIDAVAVGFTNTGEGFTFRNNKVIISGNTGQAVIPFKSTSGDDLLIEGNQFIGANVAGCTTCLEIVAGERITIRNNYIIGAFTAAVGGIRFNNGAVGIPSRELEITNNFIANLTTLSSVCISAASTTMTGRVAYNTLQIDLDAGASWLYQGSGTTKVFGDCGQYENYGVNNNGERGIIIGLASVETIYGG
jgi:hypothetical protein